MDDKICLNISLDKDLADFIEIFAAENRASVAEIFTQYVLALKRRVEGEQTDKIFSHPAFHKAMAEAQKRLRDGTAVWHTYDEIFGD